MGTDPDIARDIDGGQLPGRIDACANADAWRWRWSWLTAGASFSS